MVFLVNINPLNVLFIKARITCVWIRSNTFEISISTANTVRLSLFIVFFFSVVISYSQEFKKLKAGLGLGFGYKPSTGDYGLVIINFEPAYRLNDNVLFGIRVQNGFGPGGTDIFSNAVFGQYYFSTNLFRPLIGLGAGAYSAKETSFGIYPRIGFDFGHLNFNTDFDIVGGSIHSNFLTFKLGISIGGGRKKQ
jgi:hypothetical protein